MPGGCDDEQFGSRRNELQRRFHFYDSAEPISTAGNEKRRGLETGEMRGSQLAGSLRRMQRIGKKKKSFDKACFARGQHGRLPAPIGMTA